jgi:hypothetical protein
MLARWRDAYRTATTYGRVGWWLLGFSLVGWPTTTAWVATAHHRFDPFEQLMIFLSWGALAYAAFAAIAAADSSSSGCPHCPHCKTT